MNIQDKVYLVIQGSLYDLPIKNSVGIYKGEIVALKQNIATVKVDVEDELNGWAIQQIEITQLCTTPQQALEKASNLIMTKETKDESIQQS